MQSSRFDDAACDESVNSDTRYIMTKSLMVYLVLTPGNIPMKYFVTLCSGPGARITNSCSTILLPLLTAVKLHRRLQAHKGNLLKQQSTTVSCGWTCAASVEAPSLMLMTQKYTF
jgi:hypothetical protein